ncbi:hypothetical protein [Pseudomonas putida]|uniref:hypothetical protein n=1 Tax=Pseudomonas putida TaxID=303 RepID=UPI0021AB28D1|nr:hypothetical protein [Pseudomonas putida]
MTIHTPRSCLVHGPAGCGKTTNAPAIAKALGLSQILDNWDAGAPVPLLDTLVLTNAHNPAWYFKCRVMTFDQAMQTVHQYEHPAPDVQLNAAAWLGQAGLYRTRFDAVRNCEQSVTPVSAAELFELASKQVLSQLNEGCERG